MDEKDIIAACLKDEPGASQRLVEAYGPLVLAVAVNILGNREDAEDVFQETFLRVFRNLARYDPGRSFKTWLLAITYRRALDMIRRKGRFSRFVVRAGAAAQAAPAARPEPVAADPPPLPSHLLSRLSPKERTALCLWANEGYAAADIAEVLRCSAATARVHLFNARRKIKLLLEKAHGVLQNS